MNHSWLFRASVLVFAIALQAAAQAPADYAILANQYFQEAEALCRHDEGKLWNKSLCGPMLMVDPKTRSVFANQADEGGSLKQRGAIFIGNLPVQMNIANTATDWAGRKWTMIVLPLSADKIRRQRLMAHELWHRIQDSIGFPSSGAANNHLDSREGRVWLQLEWRALEKSLSARGKERRRYVADALAFREYRRQIFLEAAPQEREMEMHEGLAEYTGVKLSGSANPKQFTIEQNLRRAPKQETFVRSFAYASGPAYGLLLDETGKNWRKGLKKRDDLGTLLGKLMYIRSSPDLKRTANARARLYDGDKLQAAELERENNRKTLIAGYRARLVDGPVLLLPIVKMNMQMNPGNLVPLDSLGTVYPDIRISDVWGILTVTKGALIDSTFSGIHVAAPVVLTTSPIQGDGWTLELNSGWSLVVSERKGDYVVKKL